MVWAVSIHTVVVADVEEGGSGCSVTRASTHGTTRQVCLRPVLQGRSAPQLAGRQETLDQDTR